MESFEKHETFLFSICEHLPRFLRIACARFFQQDVLASFQSLHRPFEMQAIWQLCDTSAGLILESRIETNRVIYDIDIRVIQ